MMPLGFNSNEGDEMGCPLQTVNLCCGNVDVNVNSFIGPMQQLCFTLLYCTATALSKVLEAHVGMSSLPHNRWTSELLAACTSLGRCNTFTHRVRFGQPIIMRILFLIREKGCE
eukprot:scaffold23647_cov17-Tisochrysis_lutea.AAC.2